MLSQKYLIFAPGWLLGNPQPGLSSATPWLFHFANVFAWILPIQMSGQEQARER